MIESPPMNAMTKLLKQFKFTRQKKADKLLEIQIIVTLDRRNSHGLKTLIFNTNNQKTVERYMSKNKLGRYKVSTEYAHY